MLIKKIIITFNNAQFNSIDTNIKLELPIPTKLPVNGGGSYKC
jgi:hypothetical protein